MKNLSSLIDLIIPLYNKYKQNKGNLTGTQALEIMWEIGDLLKRYIDENRIRPHTLYRSIYGKSEGSTNIVQKSYIPREFQGRCYRIRNIFPNKEEIKNQFPTLKSFTCFREAMPFFDNKKYMLKGEKKKQLLTLLNCNLNPKEIIARLPKERISVRNPRTQRLHELENEKRKFIEFYNFVYNIVKLRDYKLIKKNIEDINHEIVTILSRNTAALAQDGLKFFEMSFDDSLPDPWKDYSIMVEKFTKEKDPKKLRRFRRLILPERIVRLADMLYALLSEDNFRNL